MSAKGSRSCNQTIRTKKIAIIGHGNVGKILAKEWSKVGHDIIIGARDPEVQSVKQLALKNDLIQARDIQSAVDKSDVISVAIPDPAVGDLAKSL